MNTCNLITFFHLNLILYSLCVCPVPFFISIIICYASYDSDWTVFWLFRIFLKYFAFLFAFSVECLAPLSKVYLNSRSPLCTVSFSFPSLFSLFCFHNPWWNLFLLLLHILQFSLWFHVFNVVSHCFLSQGLSVLFLNSEKEGKKRKEGNLMR